MCRVPRGRNSVKSMYFSEIFNFVLQICEEGFSCLRIKLFMPFTHFKMASTSMKLSVVEQMLALTSEGSHNYQDFYFCFDFLSNKQ